MPDRSLLALIAVGVVLATIAVYQLVAGSTGAAIVSAVGTALVACFLLLTSE